ncbi:impact family protein [Rhodotorula toruloides]|uniref:Impact family protein n=1 Tax=Rhodotorula toruloides TaxID=5286 RepID=A0A511KGJ3_RHOTO|nr:impact family protein [Rhodotorula toruloides]
MKSDFRGHAVRVQSIGEAVLALQLVITQKKGARATHHILAYRISRPASDGSPAVLLEGSDCDGERPAGKNLLELLRKADAKDVLLVVTRWYGGVDMGSERFRAINTAGKEALRLYGLFTVEEAPPIKPPKPKRDKPAKKAKKRVTFSRDKRRSERHSSQIQ